MSNTSQTTTRLNDARHRANNRQLIHAENGTITTKVQRQTKLLTLPRLDENQGEKEKKRKKNGKTSPIHNGYRIRQPPVRFRGGGWRYRRVGGGGAPVRALGTQRRRD